MLADYRLERMLPPWARLRRMAGDRPLQEQVADCDVLIPTTGVCARRECAFLLPCASGELLSGNGLVDCYGGDELDG